MFGIDVVIVLVVILVVVLIWRGPKILPKWGETLGRGVRATKQEITELQDDLQKRDDATKPPDGTRPPDGSPPTA
jgi:Sec-independent protein translocase protein TatA